eukprot:1410860-Pyramimonas_sp.AAC.1
MLFNGISSSGSPRRSSRALFPIAFKETARLSEQTQPSVASSTSSEPTSIRNRYRHRRRHRDCHRLIITLQQHLT